MQLNRQFILSALLIGASLGCARGPGESGRGVFHTLEFGNDGQGMVTEVSIDYQGRNVPRGSTHRAFGPNHAVGFSESLVVAIPESAIASWRSADKRKHEKLIPLRGLIQNHERFHGFRFFFVDDRIDVYVIYKKPGWPKILDVDMVKMHSSK